LKYKYNLIIEISWIKKNIRQKKEPKQKESY
jgi:hypothetical protein